MPLTPSSWIYLFKWLLQYFPQSLTPVLLNVTEALNAVNNNINSRQTRPVCKIFYNTCRHFQWILIMAVEQQSQYTGRYQKQVKPSTLCRNNSVRHFYLLMTSLIMDARDWDSSVPFKSATELDWKHDYGFPPRLQQAQSFKNKSTQVIKVKDQEDQTGHHVHFLLMSHTLYSGSGVSLAQKLQGTGSPIPSLNKIWSSV